GYVEVPTGVRGVCVTNQRLLRWRSCHARASRRRIIRLGHELAVIPVGDPRARGEVPQVAARGLGDIVVRNRVALGARVIADAAASRVIRWYRLLRIIG